MENCDNDKKNNGIKEQWNKRTMRKQTMNKLTMRKVKKRKTRKSVEASAEAWKHLTTVKCGSVRKRAEASNDGEAECRGAEVRKMLRKKRKVRKRRKVVWTLSVP